MKPAHRVNYFDPHDFTPEEINRIQFVASRAAVAIYKANQLEERERAVTVEERHRLRDDAHDMLAIYRFTVVDRAERLLNCLRKSGDPAHATLAEELHRDARATLNEWDSVLEDGRNLTLAEQGLVPAIKKLFGENRKWTSVELKFLPIDMPANRRHLPVRVERVLYRIVQEGLRNSLAHGYHHDHASGQIRVTLSNETDGIRLSIVDNGAGFDPERRLADNRGTGLERIKNWAKSIHAKIEIASSPGRGASIVAFVPKEVLNEKDTRSSS